MIVATKQHAWVKHTITPVSMIEDAWGRPAIFVDPEVQEDSEHNAAYGCINCSQPLVKGQYSEECPLEDDRDPV